jgi:uncharacterized protein YqjF (DUF2071 family)
MNDWVLRQLKERQFPAKNPVMFQIWRDLLFLHWRWDPAEIQKRLPAGLEVDIFDGSAWIALVPFFMDNVRARGCPALPVISSFLEMNLRTYVRDSSNRPGVWFFSLDANQPLAVWAARSFFGLPYRHAVMQARRAADWIEYLSARAAREPMMRYRYRRSGPSHEVELGSLEFFLVERYRLFTFRYGRRFSGRVYHMPYRLSTAEVSEYDDRLFELNGFAVPARPPDHVAYSQRVDVFVYSLELR